MPADICTRLSNPRRPAHGPAGAVGGQPGHDEAGTQRGERLGCVAEAAEGARPVAVHQHVGAGDERLERGPVGVAPEVEGARALAEADLDEQQLELVEGGRLDPQDVGAPGGEEPGGDRAGDDARQVEDTQAGERASPPFAPHGPGRRIAEPLDRDAGAARRRGGRARARATRRRGAARRRSHRPRRPRPPSRSAGHVRTAAADGVALGATPSTPSAGVAVLGVVRVEADPAVGGRVVAGHRVPHRRRCGSHDADVALAAHRGAGVHGVEAHRRRGGRPARPPPVSPHRWRPWPPASRGTATAGGTPGR